MAPKYGALSWAVQGVASVLCHHLLVFSSELMNYFIFTPQDSSNPLARDPSINNDVEMEEASNADLPVNREPNLEKDALLPPLISRTMHFDRRAGSVGSGRSQ